MPMTDVVALLSDLVAINSVNGSMPDGPGEAEVARFVAAFGERIGAVVAIEEVLPGRPNVLLTLPATESNGANAAAAGGRPRRLLFDVHLDTVPLDPMPDALRPTIRDGRLWGRGACDTKASLAATLVALERLAERPERQAEVCLLASVDEEYRKRGAAYAVQRGITADAAVVGE